MILLMLAAPLWAGDVLGRPIRPDPVESECPASIPIRAGLLASPELIGPDGVFLCTAVAEPVSSLAHMLALEKYHEAREQLHSLDVRLLEAERDYWQDRHTQDTVRAWYDKPSVQRWTGRIETLIVVAVVAATIGVTYDWSVDNDR